MENPNIERAGESNTKEELIYAYEEKLLGHFINEVREYNEEPITKDNCERLFEQWLSDTDVFEIQKIID